MPIVSRLLREPLVHFAAIGVALFAGQSLLSSSDDGAEDDARIDVTAAEVEWLAGNFSARWQRPPTAAELRGLVDQFVRQEVLYREALAAGLDRNDEVIRRRMVSKVEFMTEDLAAQETPTEVQLQTWFRENSSDYRTPERRRFRHVYINVDRRGDDAVPGAEELLAELRTAPDPADVAELGDRFLLQVDDRAHSEVEIGRSFGQRFAAALFEMEPDAWHGPVTSGYGLHVVRVTEVVEGSLPEFAEVRDAVLRDRATDTRQRVRDAMFSSLAERYEITIDEAAIRDRSLAAEPPAENR